MCILFRFPPFATTARLASLILFASLGITTAQAQITDPIGTSRILPVERDRYATLQEQLVNRLRATREDQQAYINYVVEQVRVEKLEANLVVAIERYAMRRNRQYPFPFFERALRYEANKRGVVLPTVEHFASTRVSQASATTQ